MHNNGAHIRWMLMSTVLLIRWHGTFLPDDFRKLFHSKAATCTLNNPWAWFFSASCMHWLITTLSGRTVTITEKTKNSPQRRFFHGNILTGICVLYTSAFMDSYDTDRKAHGSRFLSDFRYNQLEMCRRQHLPQSLQGSTNYFMFS